MKAMRFERLGVDASRNKSGGAVSHLLGFLENLDIVAHGILEVHVWSYQELLTRLPEKEWLVLHRISCEEKNIFGQLFWQKYKLAREMRSFGVDVCLNTDAASVNTFRPSLIMCRNMLPFESAEVYRHGFSLASLRLLVLRFLHRKNMNSADGVLFLSDYAKKNVGKLLKENLVSGVIPHGVDEFFRGSKSRSASKDSMGVRILYVSNCAPYKHQDKVVLAASMLRERGHDVHLKLVGGGRGSAQLKLNSIINELDPDRSFVSQHDFVPKEKLVEMLQEANIFLFASSCENFPNTLIEGMASGLPIVCSDRGPMPEVLKDGGVYFDPLNVSSIVDAIESVVTDVSLSRLISSRSVELARYYSWDRCASETFSLLQMVYKNSNRK